MNRKKQIITISILLSLLLILVIFSLCVGKYYVSASDCISVIYRSVFNLSQSVNEMTQNVVLNLRLPRIMAAILVGMALSISGLTYQSIFQNPLVSPDFLGVSTGACIGAAVAIILGFTSVYVSLFAFGFGIIAVAISVSIPLLIKNKSNITLVLSGIIVSSLMSSILGFIKYTADPESELASITYWTMGSFSYVSVNDLRLMLIVLIPSIIVLFLMSYWIDVLSLGIDEAQTLGANVKLIRTIAIISSTLLTACSVCVAGTIGWVGLIIPHFSRMLVGSSNRKAMPISILLGGIFMLLVDTITRTIGINEMPISIMTGIIGAPFFIWLLFKRRNQL